MSRRSASDALETFVDALYTFAYDQAWNAVVLFAVAAALGLAGIVLFVLSPADQATRAEIGLELCAGAVLFYLALTHGSR